MDHRSIIEPLMIWRSFIWVFCLSCAFSWAWRGSWHGGLSGCPLCLKGVSVFTRHWSRWSSSCGSRLSSTAIQLSPGCLWVFLASHHLRSSPCRHCRRWTHTDVSTKLSLKSRSLIWDYTEALKHCKRITWDCDVRVPFYFHVHSPVLNLAWNGSWWVQVREAVTLFLWEWVHCFDAGQFWRWELGKPCLLDYLLLLMDYFYAWFGHWHGLYSLGGCYCRF